MISLDNARSNLCLAAVHYSAQGTAEQQAIRLSHLQRCAREFAAMEKAATPVARPAGFGRDIEADIAREAQDFPDAGCEHCGIVPSFRLNNGRPEPTCDCHDEPVTCRCCGKPDPTESGECPRCFP